MRHMYRSFLLTLFATLFCLSASATHFMGVDVTYECLGACTYRIYHSSYYFLIGSVVSLAYTIGVSDYQEYPDMEKRFNELNESL